MARHDIGSVANALELPTLPVLEFAQPRSALVVVLPMVMLAGTVGFLLIGGGGTTSLLMGGLMAVSLVGMLVSGGGRHTKPAAQIAAERERFLRQLGRLRVEVTAREELARTAAHRDHPAPGGRRLPAGVDPGIAGPFRVRVGVGTVPAVVHCAPGTDTGDAEPEPFAAVALRWFLSARAETTGMPVTVELRPGRPLVLIGGAAGDLARSVVLCWALRVPPERLRVVLMAADDAEGWEWLRWLPHHRGTGEFDLLRTDDILVARSWTSRPTDARPVIPVGLVVTVGQPRAVRETLSTPRPGLVAIHVEPTETVFSSEDLVLHAADRRLSRVAAGRSMPCGVPDAMGPASAMSVARRMAIRDGDIPDRGQARTGSASTDLAALLGVRRPWDHRPELRGTEPAGADRLRVPIGVDDDGEPVLLDLKESSEGGAGPHGLLIGATGSGKSELLRTLVLALTVTHSPSSLNLVLIDFKGGAGFLAFADLPHVAAVITNLAEQAVLVARMRDALTGELNRRQELLRRAGNLSSLAGYERARVRSPELPALPALVVICDEFTELLVQHPDLAETFVALGRLGRSLGVHLLMASQRMDEGRTRGLDAHLSYRIALRTFSAADSRAVLDADSAYRLPSSPGAGYLRTDGGQPRRFNAAFVSGAVSVDEVPSSPRRENAVDREIHRTGRDSGAATAARQRESSRGGSVGSCSRRRP